MRKKLIVLTTILGLIAFSGVAAAEEQEPEETGDTTFNFGYDEDNGVFVWGASASDDEDCAFEDGPLQVTYGSQDGGLLVDDLSNVEGEDCQLTAGEVSGPQGQVNHGMFLKLFNSMFEGQARGCMVRHVAQSDFGMGDQQVNVPDVDPEAEGVESGDTGEIDFETVVTDCVNGEDENGAAGVDGRAKAAEMRPDRVNDMLADKAANGDAEEVEPADDDSGRSGPPDHARGKGPKG